MKKLTIILLGLIGVAYGQTISTVKVSPGITVLVPSDTVGRYIRPIAAVIFMPMDMKKGSQKV